jgi:chromosome segregation ATPase
MTRSEKVMGFLLVAVVGLWGCAKGPESANAAKNTSLEAKAQRLEEDFRAAAAARDQFKQKLLATEEKLAASETRATQLTTERDTLKTDLQAMTGHYESFRKNLKALIGQAESALANPSSTPPVTVGVQTQSGEPGSGLRN